MPLIMGYKFTIVFSFFCLTDYLSFVYENLKELGDGHSYQNAQPLHSEM